MSADTKFSIPPTVKHVGILLTVIATTWVSWAATPEGTLPLPTKLLSPVAVAFLALLGAWISWTWRLCKQTSDLRLRDRFEHDTASDMSIERSGKNKGRKICTRCLNKTPARDYPLHDPYGQGRWECSGCNGAPYEDTAFKTSQKLHFA